MRKTKREIRDFDELVGVLNRCDTLHLGLYDEEYPYVVPVSFGYQVQDGKIILYIHGATEGKKVNLLARNNKVCVETCLCHGFKGTGHSVTTEFESIIGFGTAERVTGEEAKHGLDLLLSHCGYAAFQYDEAVLPITAVYRITLHSVTGKRRTV